jgi:hypothetical protein
MSSTTIGLVSVGCIFGGTLAGLKLQRVLPVHHLSKESHEIVKLGAGMIATLTALVLGLLVSSAKNSFDAMNAGIVNGGANIILLDRVLAHYGPEAKATRLQLQRAVADGIEEIWPSHPTGVSGLAVFERVSEMEMVQDQLRELEPQSAAQRQLLAQAQLLAGNLSQTRWLLVEQSQNQVPVPLLVVLLCWIVLLFITFGLFAPRNATVITVLFVCACSVSAAIFLVVEMNRPLEGLIKLSDAPLLKALEILGR